MEQKEADKLSAQWSIKGIKNEVQKRPSVSEKISLASILFPLSNLISLFTFHVTLYFTYV
jgi:hypothetical protein